MVDDNRPYQVWSDQSTPGSVFVGHALVDARTVLNDIHTEMRANGFTEVNYPILMASSISGFGPLILFRQISNMLNFEFLT